MAIPVDVPVLVVGAGPTGMMLSLWLQFFGIQHRIVSAATSTGQTSRALVIHARSLEFYRQLGLADTIISKGTKIENFVVHHGGQRRGVIPAAESGQGLSRYPFILSITQDEHEELQEAALRQRGVTVERGVEVTGVEQEADLVRVTLESSDKQETVTARYVVGCDGAHSHVRHSAGIDMLGGTYDRAFFVADVLHSGVPSTQAQMNMCLSREDFCMVIPMPHQQGRARLIGFVPRDVEAARPDDVCFDDVRPAVLRNAPGLGVEKVNWFSRYKVHHRVAARFRSNSIFLCGDAAHIHSPVGGQGMNTGLGDATNLGWKLASVITGRAPDALLDTYAAEREPHAHKLVNTTDAMFTRLTGDGLLSLFLRNIMMPYVAPLIIRLVGLGSVIYKRISQIGIEYRVSPVSVNEGSFGQKSAAKAGDRLPWAEEARENRSEGVQDNHAVLEPATWQAHIYGKIPNWAAAKLADKGLALHTFQWEPSMAKNGLRQDVLYLVRPDGYLGLVLGATEQAIGEKALDAYTATWGIGKVL